KLARGAAAALLVLALSGIVSSCSSAQKDSAYPYSAYESMIDEPKGAKYHVILKGQNLYRISRHYGVGVEELKRYNNIWDVTDIKIGTKIYIPPHGTIKRGSSEGKRWYNATQQAAVPGPAKTSVKFIWPVSRVDISSRFGIRADRKHTGIDLRSPKGYPILAAAAGRVIFSGDGPSGYGNTVMIKHDNSAITVYAHNHSNMVKENQRVHQGQQVATVGRTGRATGNHVHFEIRINRKPVNPEKYLPRLR
ncbi:MAG: LysM peptidoglycan-binding domain-containing M23 family metallopeptidase, partial [Nitrospinota bacterium]|nr:LysM peptidoglycan-binding domain-containing M23 family metallopeptidase [Nitrospinota bacterium]